jgi:hypothetical protein
VLTSLYVLILTLSIITFFGAVEPWKFQFSKEYFKRFTSFFFILTVTADIFNIIGICAAIPNVLEQNLQLRYVSVCQIGADMFT